MILEDFLSRLDGVRRSGSGGTTKCPAHDDGHASLSVSEGDDGRILVKCFAGCTAEAIVAARGLTLADLMPEREKKAAAPKPKPGTSGLVERVWTIRDADGRPVAEHHRLDTAANGKKMWWERSGKKGLDGLRVESLPLYGVESLREHPGERVVICEGEKAADALRDRRVLAVGTATGASSTPGAESLEALRGRDVLLWPDYQDVGRAHMGRIAARLNGVAGRVCVLSWGEREKDDAADFFARGASVEDFQRIAVKAPGWRPVEVGSLAELLEDVVRFCRRFLVLSNAKVFVLALWAAHTHAIEAFDDTPFLAVGSAEPESGKTRLLEVLEPVVRNPWKVVLPSEAVLYRKVSAEQPTLLLDEVDAVFGPKAGEHEGLRALLNAGNRRGTKVPRCVGRSEIRLEEFDVFCPRALAGIGKLPDTVASRSIPLSLKRRAPGEMVEQFRRRDVEPEGHSLRDRLSAWAEANIAALRAARPASPKSLRDRTADSCEPLLAIADAAGGEWPDRARQALVELCAGDKLEDDSLGIRLLRDCRSVFDARGVEKLPSAELCAALVGLEEAPWCELYKGRPFTVHGLAKKLNPYGILPGTIRLENGTAKGYYRATFEDAWSRYLPPTGFPSVTTAQPNTGAGFLDFSNRHTKELVTDEERGILNTDGHCDGVTDKSREEGVGGLDEESNPHLEEQAHGVLGPPAPPEEVLF